MSTRPLAAVVGVGTELVTGLRIDTNTAEIASALLASGYRVVETVRVADDMELISSAFKRLTAHYAVVVSTGGLGPTHDDITREAAADALGVAITRDPEIEARLAASAMRHSDPDARAQIGRQADVLNGARVLAAVNGTAPGQVVATPAGELLLLPGPPREMRPLLATYLQDSPDVLPPRRLRCSSISESDVQVIVQRVLADTADIEFTVLAKPGDVEAVLFDDGAGEQALDAAAAAVHEALGDQCYSTDGSTLAATVVRLAQERGVTIALAESCTGGMIAAALTDVPGASKVFLGGVVSYSNTAKTALLGVENATLETSGAVSAATATEMAGGALSAFNADIALSVTGIAGPDGGTDDKPVGLVWFGLDGQVCVQGSFRFGGDRDTIRQRSVVEGLSLLRRAVLAH